MATTESPLALSEKKVEELRKEVYKIEIYSKIKLHFILIL